MPAAKNVILAGVKSVTLLDDGTVEARDLSAQFYLAEADVGKKRAAACRDRLQELNTAVAVSVVAGWPSDRELLEYQARSSIYVYPNICPGKAVTVTFCGCQRLHARAAWPVCCCCAVQNTRRACKYGCQWVTGWQLAFRWWCSQTRRWLMRCV